MQNRFVGLALILFLLAGAAVAQPDRLQLRTDSLTTRDSDDLAASATPLRATMDGMPFQWQVGEELFYKVKYTFFTVGDLYFQVKKADTVRGNPVFHCHMHMKSNSRIPFVNIDDTYDSMIDADEFYSHEFWAYEQQKDHVLYTHYDFDYDAGEVRIIEKKLFESDTVQTLDSTAVLDVRVQDGLSLLFFARANSATSNRQDVNVFAFNKLSQTFINFSGKQEEVSVKDSKVDGWFLDGKMKFVGIAGIKEDFKGWFAPGPQKVPVEAHMKAFLGSVKLFIDDWNNWEEGSERFTRKD